MKYGVALDKCRCGNRYRYGIWYDLVIFRNYGLKANTGKKLIIALKNFPNSGFEPYHNKKIWCDTSFFTSIGAIARTQIFNDTKTIRKNSANKFMVWITVLEFSRQKLAILPEFEHFLNFKRFSLSNTSVYVLCSSCVLFLSLHYNFFISKLFSRL